MIAVKLLSRRSPEIITNDAKASAHAPSHLKVNAAANIDTPKGFLFSILLILYISPESRLRDRLESRRDERVYLHRSLQPYSKLVGLRMRANKTRTNLTITTHALLQSHQTLRATSDDPWLSNKWFAGCKIRLYYFTRL